LPWRITGDVKIVRLMANALTRVGRRGRPPRTAGWSDLFLCGVIYCDPTDRRDYVNEIASEDRQHFRQSKKLRHQSQRKRNSADIEDQKDLLLGTFSNQFNPQIIQIECRDSAVGRLSSWSSGRMIDKPMRAREMKS
jgi:hypothetical protein